MRRYDMVSGILLILSIFDFTLSAPVSGQNKWQLEARVEPEEVINVLEKRAGVGDIENDMAWMIDYFRNFRGTSDPSRSSAMHSSPSLSMPGSPRPNPITSNVVPTRKLKLQPILGLGPTVAKPETKLDTTGILSSNTKEPASEPASPQGYEPNWPHYASAGESSGYDSDREFNLKAQHGRPSNPSVGPWSDTESMSSDSELEWNKEVNSKGPLVPLGSESALQKDHGQASGYASGPGTPQMEPQPVAHSTGSGGLTGP